MRGFVAKFFRRYAELCNDLFAASTQLVVCQGSYLGHVIPMV